MVKDEKQHEVENKVAPIVESKLIDAIALARRESTLSQDKAEIKKELQEGKLEDEIIEVAVVDAPKPIMAIGGPEISLGSMFDGLLPQRRKNKRMPVKNAREALMNDECDKLIDLDNVNSEAIRRAEEEGIIFIDEIDKIIGVKNNNSQDVSREGVQRDILPIVEGCTVATKYGNVKTDFILFIASGAFHVSKIEDMIPELQGRFPIRVDLDSLTEKDFKRILSQPKNAVTLQYASLLKVDNINLTFTDDALDEIAAMAAAENESSENIGARRLHTIMELLLEDISFNASGEHPMLDVVIDKNYVQNAFKDTKKKFDLKKYVL